MGELDGWMREVFEKATQDARARGFAVRGASAERRHGATGQVIALQREKRAQSDFGQFFVNVGISFDGLRQLGPLPKDTVDWMCRLEKLAPGVPGRWELRRSVDRDAMAEKLRDALVLALAMLDSVGSARDGWQNLPEIEEGGNLVLRAKLRYVDGDRAGALEDLIELERTFPAETDVAAIARQAGMTLDLSTDRSDNAQPSLAANRALRASWEESQRPVFVHVGPPPAPPPSDVVHHAKFGEGRVLSRDGEGPTAKIEVQFTDGVRVIQQRFLT